MIRNFLLVGTVVLAMGGCAPAAGPGTTSASGSAQSELARAPKVLTIGIQREPTMLHEYLTGRSESAGGLASLRMIPQNYLVVQNDRSEWVLQLAAEQLSIERNTWRVNPDGTMDTIWKIRPNVKWHDGIPFTSADLVFSLNVYKDPEIPNIGVLSLPLMESATAPDPLTFAIHWSAPFYRADQALGLFPMPRHLVEDLYRENKANFANSPRFSTEFVGLGAYRLVRWEPGSHMELARFENYYLGRPPLDTVIVRFLGDPNVMVANILSGAVDVLLPIGISLEAAFEVQRRWEGTGNQVRPEPSGRARIVRVQYRAEYARPLNGLPNRTLRQAFYHAIDRQTLAEVITYGMGPIADSWFAPNHALRPQVEVSIPQYAYDPGRSQRLLAQAGWTRGGDGVLVHQPSGDRFEVQLQGTQSGGIEKELNVIADNWKAVGARVEIYVVPNFLAGDREHRATFPGADTTSFAGDRFYTDLVHSKATPTPENRWTGINYGGYGNPKVDGLIDNIQVTIDPGRRLSLHKGLLQEVLEDVAVMPLYWDVDPVLAVKGVTGIRGRDPWNLFEWDKE